MKKLSML